jgi:hypothetical protein
MIVLMGGWTFAAGRLTGASAADVANLQDRQSRLEERQTRLEALVTDRLERIMAAQAELRTSIAAWEGETKTSVETLRTEVRLRLPQGHAR